MRVLLSWILASSAIWPMLATAAPACPDHLRIGFIDVNSPPMLMGQGETFSDPPGWSVVAMQEAAQRLGCRIEPRRLPGRRLELMLEAGQLEFSLFYGVTAERLRALHYPLDATGQPDAAWAPLFGHLSFYALVGSPLARNNAAWDGRRLAPEVRVGAVVRTTQEQFAQQRGWRVESPSSFDAALQMLRVQRFDLLLSPRETMRPELLGGEGGLVELQPVAQRLPYFVLASPQLMASHPDFARAFWREACQAVRRVAPHARPVDCGIAP